MAAGKSGAMVFWAVFWVIFATADLIAGFGETDGSLFSDCLFIMVRSS